MHKEESTYNPQRIHKVKNKNNSSKIAWAQALADSGALDKFEQQTQPAAPLVVTPAPTDEEKKQAARSATDPTFAAVSVICSSKRNKLDSIDVEEVFTQLKSQVASIKAGDLSLFDAMLTSQAVALQALFADFAEQATAGNKSPEHREACFKLAMRAQNQSRSTIQTLLDGRNPAVFIKNQANVSNGGPQQINNGLMHASAPAREIAPIAEIAQIAHSKLSSPNVDQIYGLHPNQRASIAAIAADTHNSTLEEVDRA